MKQDERAPFVHALQRARTAAYPPCEFVDQESFMRASEIRVLADQAGIASGVSVLDLCCGIAGPGRFITRELGCTYLGVDYSSSAIELARKSAGDLPCRFEVSRIPPVPSGPFDVVLLLETMLAFPDKERLLEEISEALTLGGRFALSMEEGLPLTKTERDRMPDADTVWLTPCRRCSVTWRGPGSWSAGKRTAVVPTVPWRTRCSARSPLTLRTLPRRSDTGHWRNCSSPTGYGAAGSAKDASARSPWSRKRPKPTRYAIRAGRLLPLGPLA